MKGSNNVYLYEGTSDYYSDLTNLNLSEHKNENLLKVNYFECKISYEECSPKWVNMLTKKNSILTPSKDSFRRNWSNSWNMVMNSSKSI